MSYTNGSTVTYVDNIGVEGLTFRENEEATFDCTVTGANPPPMVKIMIGDQDISGLPEVAITDPQAVEAGTGPAGYKETTYTVTAKVSKLKMSMEYRYKDIICQAKTSHMMKPMQKKVTIKFPQGKVHLF